MSSYQKYHAQPQIFEGTRFDSRWELSVYLHLRGYIPKDNLLIHQKILIKPQTSNYKAKYWNADFIVQTPSNKCRLIIEAKGVPTSDFKRQLQLIDSNRPELIPIIRIITQDVIRIDECFKRTITPKLLSDELKIIQQEILRG